MMPLLADTDQFPIAPLIAGVVAFGAAVLLGSRALASAEGAGSATDADSSIEAEGSGSAAATRWVPGSMRESLMSAGIMDGSQQLAFLAVHVASTVLGGLVGMIGALRFESGVTSTLVVAAGLVIGWWIPASWLAGRRERRRAEIAADFPMMLDLLEIGLSGGLGLEAAWSRVRETIRGGSGAMYAEMRRVEVEVEFGVPWAVSLERAAVRSQVPAFRSLASLFGQSQRFGTELSRVVIVLSDSLRLESSQMLEERAHVASVRLLIPLGLLLFPATIIVFSGPLFLMLFETLQGVNAD